MKNFLIGTAVVAVMCGTIIGVAAMSPEKEPVPVTVSSFNDGFRTSKQDDCQQGFQAACEWLQTTR